MTHHNHALLILTAVSVVAIVGLTLFGSGRLTGFQGVDFQSPQYTPPPSYGPGGSPSPATSMPPPPAGISWSDWFFDNVMASMANSGELCKVGTTKCRGNTLEECKLATPSFCSWCDKIPTEVETECYINCLGKNVEGNGPAVCARCEPDSICENNKIMGINPRTCDYTTMIEDCGRYLQGGRTGGCEPVKMYNSDLKKDVISFHCVCNGAPDPLTQESVRVSCKGESIEPSNVAKQTYSSS